MLPITKKTTLSFKKYQELVKNLQEVQKSTHKNDLPAFLKKALEKQTKEHQQHKQEADDFFVQQVDAFFRKTTYKNTDAKLIETIVTTCPEFLATTINKCGQLPIHRAAFHNADTSLFTLFVRLGIQHEVGGAKNSRGGLLVKGTCDINVLQYLTENAKHIDTFEALCTMDPPLLSRSSLVKYDLLHEAAGHRCLETVQYFTKMSPSSLYTTASTRNRVGVPLAFCIGFEERIEDKETEAAFLERKQTSLEIIRYLIRRALSYKSDHESIGGLFTTPNILNIITDKTVLELLVKSKYGEEEVWETIRRAMNSYQDTVPILHQVIKHTPKQYGNAFEKFPDAVFVRASNKRLPVHVALETGNMKWSQELLSLIQMSRSNLTDEVDPVTNLPAFGLAAMENSCDLSTIYYLLRKNPHHVDPCI